MLRALSGAGYLSIEEIQEKIGEANRRKVIDNINAAKADNLVDRTKDEITGLPVYHITPTGQQRLGAGQGVKLDKFTGELCVAHEIDPLSATSEADDPVVPAPVAKSKRAEKRYRNIDFDGGLVGDADFTDFMEARDAAVTHAQDHRISVDVCQVVGTANFESIPTVNWSSAE